MAKALIGFLLLLVLPGRPLGLARHGGSPHLLVYFGMSLGLFQAFSKLISMSLRINILKIVFDYTNGVIFLVFSLPALKVFNFA